MPPIILSNGVEIERAEVLDYFNEYYLSALVIYNRYRKFGFPWIMGYQEMPAYLITIYELFEHVIDQGSDPKVAKARKKKWQ